MQPLLKGWKSRFMFYILTLICTALIACNVLQPSSEQTSPEAARSAAAFVDSIGVAVHLNYRDTAYRQYNDIIKPKLVELGIHHIRDGVSLRDTETQQKFNQLAGLGIKSTLVMDPRKRVTPAKAVEIAKSVVDSVEAVEGPNEWDLDAELDYQGHPFPQGVRKFQSELYEAIKRDPATAHLEILSPSVADASKASELGELACDVGNMHSYALGGEGPTQELDEQWIPSAQIMCGSQPIIATECGYHNAIIESYSGVSEQASGKYLPRLFLEYFNRGIKRAYSYELIDLKPNPEANVAKFHYGLLRNDGSPKPAFIALKNLILLLKEPDEALSKSFSLGSLDYRLRGNLTGVHHTLLQKRNGKFYLILWQEVTSFDRGPKTDIVIPERQVTLTLNSLISQAEIYQPIRSIVPISQYKDPKKLELQIPDHPLVIEFS